MYQIDTRTTQSRASQLPQTSRNTNPRVSTSTEVIHRTNVSRPLLRSNQIKDKVIPNNSQVKFMKTEVEDHHRISSISNKRKSVTTCNDSLKSRISNVNVVCATCGKCVSNSNHDACVSKFIHDVNAITKKPKVVPISTRQPKSQANKSIATPPKKTVASDFTIQKPKRSNLSNVPSSSNSLADCSTHPIHCTVCFGNDKFALILGYGDLVQGNITINRVYYVEGLNYNLFSVSQFCDADLEVAFRKSTCSVRDLQGNDFLTAWLWYQRLSHLNFDYINLLSKENIMIGLPKLKYVKDQLCSSCKMSKSKRSSFKIKVVPSSKGRLNLLQMNLCCPMRVESINGKKYILVIQRNLQAQVISIQTDRGMKFLNKTLHAYFKEEGIEHQTSTPRTLEQKDVIERRNRTLVEAAQTMLSAFKLPLFFWAEAIAIACYTQKQINHNPDT
ncbi:retrovirus-related pol polyprotein from transposon TNT 1-94 [Tanacetum coccineum]